MRQPMSPEMKEELQRKRESREIYERLHAKRRSKFPEPKRNLLVIPEDYKGTDLRRAKKLIAKRMKEENKEVKKRLLNMKVKEIDDVAKKLSVPVTGKKMEKIQTLMNYFQTPGYWKTIVK